MTDIVIGELIEQVYRFGAVPLLLAWVYYLTKQVNSLQKAVDKKQQDHVIDLKSFGEEYAGLIEKMLHGLQTLKNDVNTWLQNGRINK